MDVSGWCLFQYPLFENQLRRLMEAAEQLSITQPDVYEQHPTTKLLATIHCLITQNIPRDPNAPKFVSGHALDIGSNSDELTS
jgi:toxin YhaV